MYKGRLDKWDAVNGYGFIRSDELASDTFIHISALKHMSRQHCSQMTSREEAVFFIQNCPNTKMDGDYDGVPCENDSRF